MPYDPELAQRIRELLDDEPDLIEKRMFGGLAWMVGGHLAVGLVGGERLLVRVGAARVAQLLATAPEASQAIVGSRQMTGWLTVDYAALEEGAVLERWLARGLEAVYELESRQARDK